MENNIKFEGKRSMNGINLDEKPRNRLREDTKNNLNKYNFNMNKRRGKGLMSGSNGSFDPTMNNIDINERFVYACENGDYPTVMRILEALKDFNIDVTDNLGRTALRLAVENEHLEVVQALLGKSDSQKMREALLLAIYLGHTQIAESILRHPKYKVLNEKKFVNEDTDSFWQTPSSDDAQFSPDITPLILAAQYNRTEIVQMLLIGGDRITKPHNYHCKCNECSNKFKFDSLRHAQSRLNAYRGLASESYISLASVDPILTAFELGRELRSLSGKEKYFKNEYLQLADNLSLYAVKLLNNVRGRDELEILLNKTGKETEEKYERLARLDLALKYQEKPFVAHSNCQQKLVEIWQTGLRKITKMNQLFIFLFILAFILYLPIGCLIYIFVPKIKISRFLCQPCIKFASHTITYLAFISMIIVSSLQFADEQKKRDKFSINFTNYSLIFFNYSQNSNLKYRFNVTDFYIRSNSPSQLDIAINIWIIGFCWHEAKQIYQDGIKDYLLAWNNIIDSCMNILYVCSFALKYYTMVYVSMNRKQIQLTSFWNKVANINESDINTQKEIYETFYWLNDDRFYWASLDPINMAEGLFALANIFSFCRICFLLPANQALGPLQITLGKMISDIVKFIFIFLIIFAAFMFSLNNLYWYYQSNTRGYVEIVTHFQADNSTTTSAEQAFGTIGLTFQSIFWAIFGLGDGNNVKLDPFNNYLTENFGYVLYGAFHIASIIVLLNMLIAMMAKSYEDILLHSDIEWKFSRSKLYMEFIRSGATLPVPMNIIPTPKSVYYIILKFFKLLCCCCRKKSSKKRSHMQNNTQELPTISGQKKSNNNNNNNYDHQNHNNKKNGVINNGYGDSVRRLSLGGNDLTYTKVMQRIVKRFLLHKQRESDDVKESDFDELKQDLQMVRFEMLNDIKKSEDETLKYISLIHNGIAILGDEILKETNDLNLISRFKDFKQYDNDIRDSIEVAENNNNNNNNNNNELMQRVDKLNNFQTGTLNSQEKASLKRSWPTINIQNETQTNLIHSLSVDSIDPKSFENDFKLSKNEEQSLIRNNNLDQIKKMSMPELEVINEEDEFSNHVNHMIQS